MCRIQRLFWLKEYSFRTNLNFARVRFWSFFPFCFSVSVYHVVRYFLSKLKNALKRFSENVCTKFGRALTFLLLFLQTRHIHHLFCRIFFLFFFGKYTILLNCVRPDDCRSFLSYRQGYVVYSRKKHVLSYR